jgi:hypothetical protein
VFSLTVVRLSNQSSGVRPFCDGLESCGPVSEIIAICMDRDYHMTAQKAVAFDLPDSRLPRKRSDGVEKTGEM